MTIRTQQDIIEQSKGIQPLEEVRKLKIPGIESLHTRPLKDIAESLAVILRMESGITEFKWVLGSHVEVTIKR